MFEYEVALKRLDGKGEREAIAGFKFPNNAIKFVNDYQPMMIGHRLEVWTSDDRFFYKVD